MSSPFPSQRSAILGPRQIAMIRWRERQAGRGRAEGVCSSEQMHKGLFRRGCMGKITAQGDIWSWAKNGPVENFYICNSRLKTRLYVSRTFCHLKVFSAPKQGKKCSKISYNISMKYQMSHSFPDSVFQTNFQRWHFHSLSHSWWAVIFQWRDAKLKHGWLRTPYGGVEGALWGLDITSYSMLLLLFIPCSQRWPQNFSVWQTKCHSNAEARVLYLSLITALLFLEYLPNSNIVCKLSEQRVQGNLQCYLLNQKTCQQAHSQFLPFQLEQNSHQLQLDSHWNKSLKVLGSDLTCLSYSTQWRTDDVAWLVWLLQEMSAGDIRRSVNAQGN